jgi:hypothetical protein
MCEENRRLTLSRRPSRTIIPRRHLAHAQQKLAPASSLNRRDPIAQQGDGRWPTRSAIRLFTSIRQSAEEHCQDIGQQARIRDGRGDGRTHPTVIAKEWKLIQHADVLLRIHWQFRTIRLQPSNTFLALPQPHGVSGRHCNKMLARQA